ncbi:hypothetical protein R5R35_009728 [Gryllus longicercus]|uniref:Innexin n=1 Tax=Gryllus longicercus TaxID=2509291 RepID=A0AAN9W0X9_9ORTH
MLSTFEGIAKNINLKPKLRTIDNVVFKLHYRITFLLLVVATILVCSRQYIGEHIRCISDIKGDVSIKMVETYCFFSATFTVVRHLDGEDASSRLHPGVGPWTEADDTLHHAYYQWVPFVLFFQAIMFYLPHLLWRKLDGGTLFKMAQALHNYTLAADERAVDVKDRHIPTKGERDARIREVRRAFVERLPYLRGWARKLMLCECLNLANVVGQFFVTDAFLAGRFAGLGASIVGGSDVASSPLDQVFPKMTKCVFRKFGPSGTIQNYDALCVMALNIINEKIYAFLWFWFVILFVATALGLIWRVVTLLLHRRSDGFNLFLFRSSSPGADEHSLHVICRKLSFSHWLFLYYLGKNMDGFVFEKLLSVIADHIDSGVSASAPEAGRLSEDEGDDEDDDNPKNSSVSKELLDI